MPFDATPQNPAVELIDRTLELIATPEQWCKNAFKTCADGGPQRYCIIGAMEAIAGDSAVIDDVEERLDKLLGRSVMDYNDAFMTTHADVVAVLRRIRGEFSHAV